MHTPNARQLLDMLGYGGAVPPPDSAVRDLREGRRMTQTQVAAKSGVPQAYIAQIESGARRLTEEQAARLAPVLGVGTDELLLADEVSTLQRAATKGELDPELMSDAIMKFAKAAPDTEMADDLVGMMIEILRKATRTYEGGSAAAAKSKDIRPRPETRDVHGRRVDMPYGTPATDDDRDPTRAGRRRRDAHGNLIRKLYDPKDGR
jgi:transcriptional regulator with XRE-family HTH domain